MEGVIHIIIFSTLLFELILLLSWQKSYFRNGIPVYKKKYQYSGSKTELFDEKYLESIFKSGSTNSIFFRKFNDFECGFREKLWDIKLFNFIPVMRGLIKSNKKDQTFCIIGYLNWYILILALYIITSFASGKGPAFVPLLILVGVMWGFQFYRYNKIAEVAFEWLENNN